MVEIKPVFAGEFFAPQGRIVAETVGLSPLVGLRPTAAGAERKLTAFHFELPACEIFMLIG